MRQVAIVTDSTAYIPKALVEKYQIRVVPLRVHWGSETYRDGVDIQSAEFYERLKTDRVTPTTAAPSIGDFQLAYREALESAEAVVSIHIASTLSATVSSAEQAKALLPDKPIEVIDSNLTSMALGYMALVAARAAEEGATVEQVAAAARRLMTSAHIVFTVDTLEYLRRGGRIGAAQAFMGNLMDVKPILELRDGRVEPVERVRTKKKAVERVMDMIVRYAASEDHAPVRVAAVHALAPEEATALLDAVSARLNVVEKMIADFSPVIATHTGPGTLGLVCTPA
jgi:DegV family protein with EDD domain